MKTCPKCKKEKEYSDYSKNKNRIDGLQRLCKSCVAEQTKKSYNKNPQAYKNRIKKQNEKCSLYIDHYKAEKGCIKCKEKRYWVLDFHHVDPNEKKFNIGDIKKLGVFNKIKNEIDKCIVLCKNCHYDFHYQEKNNNITIEKYLN